MKEDLQTTTAQAVDSSDLFDKPKPHDWLEDFHHENGKYESNCKRCNSLFMGHKRRLYCKVCDGKRKQIEINRLRAVLHEIADSRPDQHMDIEKTPELTTWICDTCTKAKVGAYPSNTKGE